ncbi:uncharacterized protein LOC132194315 [Neocloeon triangulifer]|uniref:uncharacterized protein LOC132194315 n=1 Tax=Neocloeon triangulifer TaxID=2078957 RepID=UPI00286FA396|nr:uncharacterized protein LOC132194315 [Neocloeon triangulifer]
MAKALWTRAALAACLIILLSLGSDADAVDARARQRGTPKRKKEANGAKSDLSTSASWWNGHESGGADFFSGGGGGGHGLVQNHPLGSGPSAIGGLSTGFSGSAGGSGFGFGPSSHFGYDPLTGVGEEANELQKNPALSSPEECARACRDGEPPRTCYFKLVAENYMTLGAACALCAPNATNGCQCVLADGVERGILTLNRQIPAPSIQVCEGDRVIIDVDNRMQGIELAIHWHGLHQRGTQYYDGVPMLTQCPIPEGTTFRYQWNADNPGTHFYHAHTGTQKLDGLQGSIVVRSTPARDLHSHLYDFDLTNHVMMIQDWMHEDSTERFPGRLQVRPGQDPDTILINGRGQFRDPQTGLMTNTPLEVFTVTPGRRYRFRLINAFCTVCPAQLTIEGHPLTVIASDGEPVQPTPVNTIISFTGERYDFVINADQPVGAYWIQVRGLGECGISRVQQLGILRYARGPYDPVNRAPSYDFGLPQGVVLNPLDAVCNTQRSDAICVSNLKNAQEVEEAILQQHPDVKIFLPFRFLFLTPEQAFRRNAYNRFLVAPTGDHVVSLVDNISFVFPKSPPLSQPEDIPPQQYCNGDDRPPQCGANCMCTHNVDIPLNAIVEVVLVDEVQQPNLSHPFHLHGYSFNVVGIGRSPDSTIKKINLKHALDLDRQGLLHRQFNHPPAKDTIAVPNNGYVILRFRADNPGFWLFHCHFLYHIMIGMNLVLHVGNQADLPPVPPNFPRCGDHLPPIQLAH